MRRKPPPPEPPPYSVCGWCGEEIPELTRILCPRCTEIYGTTLDSVNAIREKYANVDPADIPREVAFLLTANAFLTKVYMHMRELTKRRDEYNAWYEEYLAWEQRPGRQPKASTEWLRAHHQGRSMSDVYPEWLAQEEAENTPEAWNRFQRLWRREIGGNK